MDAKAIPYVAPLILSAAVAGGLSIYCWRHKEAPSASALSWLMAAIAWWAFFYTLAILAPSLELKIWWTRVKYLAVAPIPLLWLVFALKRTGREAFLTRARIGLLLCVPAVTIALAWTSDFHDLIWVDERLIGPHPAADFTSEYGAWFYLNALYAYLLMLGGAVILILDAARLFNTFRKQAILLFLAVVIPLVGNMLFIAGYTPNALDFTPFGFGVSGILVVWAALGFHLLDLVPTARAKVLETMPDGVIIIDHRRRTVDANPTGRRILANTRSGRIGRTVSGRLAGLFRLLDTVGPGHVVSQGVPFTVDGESRLFDVGVSSVVGTGRGRVGTVLVFRDVTQRGRVEEALRSSNQALEYANARLREEIAHRKAAQEALARSEAVRLHQIAVEAKEEERKRFAEELGGQTLAELPNLIGEMELLVSQTKETQSRTALATFLPTGIEGLRRRLRATEQGLRQTVQAIYPSVLTNLGLVPALRAYFEQLAAKGTGGSGLVRIELLVSGFGNERLPEELELAAYRIAQQGVDNAIKRASLRVIVKLQRDTDRLIVEVRDDGAGLSSLLPQWTPEAGHLGLGPLKERIISMRGEFQLTSVPDAGTAIFAQVPLLPVFVNAAMSNAVQRATYELSGRPR